MTLLCAMGIGRHRSYFPVLQVPAGAGTLTENAMASGSASATIRASDDVVVRALAGDWRLDDALPRFGPLMVAAPLRVTQVGLAGIAAWDTVYSAIVGFAGCIHDLRTGSDASAVGP